MREIKIRYVVQDRTGKVKVSEPLSIETIETNTISPAGHKNWERIIARNLFTGNHDIDGKEIYWDDIIEYQDGLSPYDLIGDEDSYPLTESDAKSMKVIGNIHLNPELLEEK